MENAADALKMAAAVLVFVLALGISISSFSEVRQVSQIILNYNDNEYNYTYIPDERTTTRMVGLETITPSIYRSYNEKFAIYFYEGDTNRPYTIYKQKDTASSPTEDVNKLDLSKISLANVQERNDFIGCILYGQDYSNFSDMKTKLQQRTPQILLQNEGLYDKINGEVKEMFGIYELQDVSDGTDDSDSAVPDANKTEIRTISYIINPN